MRQRTLALLVGVVVAGALVSSCVATNKRSAPPLPTAGPIDLPRFMGQWYVIASIPTWLERGAVDATERYTLRPDGTVDIDFRYRKDSAAAQFSNLGSRGFVSDTGNAVWGVQFVWPIKADYRIAWLADDYSRVIVAREKRDYVWIMARTPTLPEADLRQLERQVAAMGYDPARLVRVSHTTNAGIRPGG